MSPREEDQPADRIIREALERDAAELPPLDDDPSMVELLMEAFRGRHRRLAIAGVVLNLGLLGGAIYGAIRFLRTDDIRTMLVWGSAMILCVVVLMAVKVWYWLGMARLSVTRDLKRLELQVSRLGDALRDQGSTPGGGA